VRETDLYAPVKRFLQEQGYDVKGEVGDCDVLAVREGTMVAVELKTRADLKLILQAVARVGTADNVYVAIPHDSPLLRKDKASFMRLLRMLGLGLLVVNATRCSVAPELDPRPYSPRKRKDVRSRLLAEHAALVGDPNAGGSPRRSGRMTAYRQRAMAIASLLLREGPSKASVVRDSLSEPGAWRILHDNVYGWFEKIDGGIYYLSPRGMKEPGEWSAGVCGGCAGLEIAEEPPAGRS
jgi:hypothetical protein